MHLLLVLEILHLFLWIRNNSVFARFPISRANFAVLVCVLKGLQKSQSFVYTPAHGQIIHRDLAQNSLVVDDKKASEAVTVVLQIDAVILGDFVSDVGQKRNVEGSQTACFQDDSVKITLRNVTEFDY